MWQFSRASQGNRDFIPFLADTTTRGFQRGECIHSQQVAMAAAISTRGDFDAGALRAAARRSKDGPQARRLLALAAIYDGATRTEAAKIDGVGLQVVRDWVLRFNAHGPDGLIDRRAPGQAPRLNERASCGAGGDPGERTDPGGARVVRWRIVDPCQWIFEVFRISVSQQTLSRVLRTMGYRKLSARPRHQPRPKARSRILKKSPRPPGRNRTREGRRSWPIDLVRRRGADRPEKQDHPPLGQARNAPERAKRPANASAYIFGAICPKEGKGAALVMPRCDTEAMTLHLAEIATQIARRARTPPSSSIKPAGIAPRELEVPPNITLIPLPAKCPELNPQENVWQFLRDNWLSNFQILRTDRRPLLRRLEQARRSALAHHLHRNARMGLSVLISASLGINYLSQIAMAASLTKPMKLASSLS